MWPGVAMRGWHRSPLTWRNTCYSILGEAFDLCQYEQAIGLEELRDRMGALKYELIARYSHTDRHSLLNGRTPEEYWHTVLEELVAEVDCYDSVVEANSAYRPRHYPTSGGLCPSADY